MIVQTKCTFVSNENVHVFLQITLFPNANIVFPPQSTAVISNRRIISMELIQLYELLVAISYNSSFDLTT